MSVIEKENTKLMSPYNDEELAYFREIILNKKKEAERELEIIQSALQEAMEYSKEESAYSSHMADASSDIQEREKKYILHNRTRKFIRYLEDALERIDNKTYGICKVSGEKILKGRLEAVPHTQLSIQVKLRRR